MLTSRTVSGREKGQEFGLGLGLPVASLSSVLLLRWLVYLYTLSIYLGLIE